MTKKFSDQSSSDRSSEQLSESTNVSSRRKALKVGTLGAVAWKTPVLTAVVTPAHAQMSVVTTTTTTMAPVNNIVTTGPTSFNGTLTFTT